MTRITRLTFLGLVTVVLSAVPLPGAAQVLEVTLDEATTMALRANPAIVQALGDIRIAEASRLEYYGDWLPNISGSSSLSTNSSSRFNNETQTTVSTGSSTSYSAGLTASMTLFDGFRRNAVGRSTGANVESAEADLVNQRFQVTLQTKQAFFNAVAAEELVRVAQTRIERAEGQLRISKDKLAAGNAIRSDTLRSFVELGNAKLQLLNAQTQRATATANLARLIGYDGPVGVISDSASYQLVAVDTAALRIEALDNSPTVLQSAAQSRAANAQVGVSRSQIFPSISASYSQSWAGQAVSSLNNTWSARLNLSWPLFNGFTRESGITRSLAQQEAAYARVEDTRRLVAAQVTQQFAALESALVRFQIAQASRAAADEDLRVQQERYRLGASTIVDVLTTQVNLDQAEVDIVQARLDYLVARSQIEALIGREI